jgi:hypothetical protein
VVLAQLLALPPRPLPHYRAGLPAFGAFALVEAGLGHSLIGGNEPPVFLGTLAVADIFEISWYLARRTNAMTWPAR